MQTHYNGDKRLKTFTKAHGTIKSCNDERLGTKGRAGTQCRFGKNSGEGSRYVHVSAEIEYVK